MKDKLLTPVDFLTAFRAFRKGGIIRVDIGMTRRFDGSDSKLYNFNEKEIAEGQWYIES